MMSMTKSNNPVIELNEDMIRHMILNAIRAFRVKFNNEYGELVLACDHTNVWRKKIFPYYKANRKKSSAQLVDWTDLYRILSKIREEIKQNFPYKVLHIETAEADDIIGALVEKYGSELNVGEKILIISTDKDYIQLHTYANVFQYDPVFKKKMITHPSPETFLKEHIIRGDSGDGVPNILSDDDTFVTSKRQKPMTDAKIEALLKRDWNRNPDRNYSRNRELIDLSFIPEDLKNQIYIQYDVDAIGNRSNLLNYFMKNKLKLLTKEIGAY